MRHGVGWGVSCTRAFLEQSVNSSFQERAEIERNEVGRYRLKPSVVKVGALKRESPCPVVTVTENKYAACRDRFSCGAGNERTVNGGPVIECRYSCNVELVGGRNIY
jgi:hypothetical protein